MKIKNVFFVVAILFSYMASSSIYAQVTCKIVDGTINVTSNLSGAPVISVPPDVPIGTRIFSSRVKSDSYTGGGMSYSCTGAPKEQFVMDLMAMVRTGTNLGDNKTFDSGYPGIGVQFWIAGDYIASPQRIVSHDENAVGDTGTTIWGANKIHREITIFLVKTGDVKPGVINASAFPFVSYFWAIQKNVTMDFSIFSEFHFTGKITVVTPTCKTPERVDVDLGTYTSSEINNNGSSPWKDASIRLTECPRFTGYVKTEGALNVINPGDSSISYASKPINGPNHVGITLNGVQGNLDTANGIVGIAPGLSSASGIGVQIASGTTGANSKLSLGVENLQEIPMDGASTVNIPLVVRMVRQGQSTVKAGRVESQITYLINYK